MRNDKESSIDERYLGSDYIDKNPTWDIEDSPWKAGNVRKILENNNIRPTSIAEVGCGAGGVLSELRKYYPDVALSGFDIAPDAQKFWEQFAGININFRLGDFFKVNDERYDIILLLDILEHLPDPFKFLDDIVTDADYFVIHFPLDLSSISVFREKPLLYVRDKVGHLQYYTKGLALALLDDCGFEVIDCQYTGAAFNAPQRTYRTRLAGLFRRIAYMFGKDRGVRLLGGETLMVLAKKRK